MTEFPDTAERIEAWLDQVLEVEFSFLKTAQPARALACLDSGHREFVLDWTRRVASTNIQVAWRFVEIVVPRITSVDYQVIESWALNAVGQYDRLGLRAALEAITGLDDFVGLDQARRHGILLQDHLGVLQRFLHGLSGRALGLQQGDELFTDTETLYVPPVISLLADPAENFQACKCMLAFSWAAIRFGQFRCLEQLQALDTIGRQRLQALEAVRLSACLRRELPGLHRRYRQFRARLYPSGEDPRWSAYSRPVTVAGARMEDSLELLQRWPEDLKLPEVDFCQPVWHLDQVQAVMAARIDKERQSLRRILRQIIDEQGGNTESDESPPSAQQQAREPRFTTEDDGNDPHDLEVKLLLDDKPVPLPESAHALLRSIVLDQGRIPEQYLQPAGPGGWDDGETPSPDQDVDEVWQGTYHERGALLYDEWDYQRRHYRKSWCAVRELKLEPVYDDFAQQVLTRYRGLVHHLHRSFEALREEDRVLKRQQEGDGVDVDAMVEALADSRDGSEMSDRLYTRLQRCERNTAVCFMVDMSGSTRGWINTAEREALLLLAEALESLGDRYAIYGFSGMARKRCEIYVIKEFSEQYSDEVKARISAMEPRDYTRMGFAIRHLSMRLNQVEARTRLLVCISDGKPDDYDSYRGRYGIEDTRRALLEARYTGIHPYCITIDRDAGDYLPYMYGPASYTVIDEVQKLPLKVSDIYRRLST